jgi:hypothetical protein
MNSGARDAWLRANARASIVAANSERALPPGRKSIFPFGRINYPPVRAGPPDMARPVRELRVRLGKYDRCMDGPIACLQSPAWDICIIWARKPGYATPFQTGR